MIKFITRRLLVSIITFFGITIIVFLISNLAPGSPLDALLIEPGMTEDEMIRRAAALGLDKPLHAQYISWIGEFFRGNLGYSFRTFQPVIEMVFERIWPTIILTFSATFIAYIIAVPLGIISSIKPYSHGDYIFTTLAFMSAASPSYFIGMLLILLLTVNLGWLPMGGMYYSLNDKSITSLFLHLIMPSIALSLPQMGSILRHTRSSMLEVLSEDYVRTARAKGLREWKVIVVHALRNALIPLLTNFGLSIPFLIGGAVVTEQVFSWPGLGTLMVSSISARDYPTIMGITVIISIGVLIGNIFVDLIYGLIDPRIRVK